MLFSVILTLCDFLEFWTSVIRRFSLCFPSNIIFTQMMVLENTRDKQTGIISQILTGQLSRIHYDWFFLQIHHSPGRLWVYVCVCVWSTSITLRHKLVWNDGKNYGTKTKRTYHGKQDYIITKYILQSTQTIKTIHSESYSSNMFIHVYLTMPIQYLVLLNYASILPIIMEVIYIEKS